MSEVVTKAVDALNKKLADSGFDDIVKFVIEGEGSLMIDAEGVREGDEKASVTLTASADTFNAILDGSENPTAAFMSGKLAVDGNMGAARKLAGVLS